MSTVATIEQLHRTFCTLTGVQLRMGLSEYSREWAWHQFVKAGFTVDDLICVLRYLQHKIRKGERNPGAVRFSNLIERLELFEETLQMGRAEQRKPKPTALSRIKAMRERPANGGTPALTPNTAKPVADYIAALRQAAS